MNFTSGPVMIGIKQNATAKAKNYRVRLGFRPAMIQFWHCEADGDMRDGVWIDGSVDADSDSPHTGAFRKLTPSDQNVMADIGSDGITPLKDGFRIGQDAAFKTDAVKLWFLCHRTTYPIKLFDLSKVGSQPGDYGKGTLFGVDHTKVKGGGDGRGDTVAVFEE